MAMIDIGANLINKRYSDIDDVLARAREADIARIIVTGTSESVSEKAVMLAQKFPDILSATVGVHPHDARHWSEEAANRLKALYEESCVVAVGECGLDFNRNFSPVDQQLACFEQQLQMAQQIAKPVFLHQRDAHVEFIKLLRAYRSGLVGAVVHCFTGSRQEMEEYVELDCYIGVTGWVTDEARGQELKSVIPHIPFDRLLVETDAPYLTPKNMPTKPRGGRNEPCFLPYVIEKISELLGRDVQEISDTTSNNAKSLFRLEQ